jgi:hypothetical protein
MIGMAFFFSNEKACIFALLQTFQTEFVYVKDLDVLGSPISN